MSRLTAHDLASATMERFRSSLLALRQGETRARLFTKDFAWAKAAGRYALAAIVTLGSFVYLQRLWQADFTAPLAYSNDGLMIQTWWKAVLDFGWYLDNPLLGAPHGQHMHDYPLVETLNFLLIKFFGVYSHDLPFVTNAFVLATYVLATWGSLAALRQMGVSYWPALAVSVLFAFLPYHFYRLTGHHFLACYYIVPLSSLLALWVYQGRVLWPPGARATPSALLEEEDEAPPASWAASITICVLQASAGIYYAVFALYFLHVAGLSAALRRRSLRPLWGAALLVGVTTATIVANLAPSLIYRARHGVNTDIATRQPREAEWFGYKIAASMLPIPDHKIKPLSDLRWTYERETVRSNEGAWAAHGMVANVGFVSLFGLLLARRSKSSWLEGLSILNVFGVLLGTIGGFGMVFNMLVSAQIRSYNRISIYLSFFALACVALLLEKLWRRTVGRIHLRRLMVFGLVAMVAFGTWDQYPRTLRPDYGHVSRQWHKDHRFVKQIEAAQSPGAMVYQLPFTRYPESPAVLQHHAYFAIRFYLHSDWLRWSCGSVRGREGDRWQMEIAELPLDEQLDALVTAGFTGIHIARPGYDDYGAAIEANLRERLGVEPIVSEHGRDSFFSMENFRATRAMAKAGAATRQLAQNDAATNDLLRNDAMRRQ